MENSDTAEQEGSGLQEEPDGHSGQGDPSPTQTEEHDLEVKIKHIRKFLDQHNKVKISMMFRGREIAYTDIGRKIMEDLKNTLADGCVIDQQPKLEGRNMIMIISPKK